MDKIKCDERDLPQHVKVKLEDAYISLVGLLNWPSTATRLDIATIANILSVYVHKATPSHLAAVKHVIKNLKGSTDTGIHFPQNQERKCMHLSDFQWILLK